MCLTMIVKNESHCIKETLNCMLPYIDYYVICDTGSNDNTKEIIKNFFDSHKIKGEIYDHKWVNFGHNRTLAMQMAYRKSEYLWVMDADDLIVGKVIFPKKLVADSYLFTFGQNFTYERALIFNNKLKWEYRGVLHEFANCVNKKNPIQEKCRGDWHIDSRRLGDRNKDPEKYKKDALLLMDAINRKVDPDLIERYYFYTGQSWKDYGDYEKAIEWYQKRVDKGGWPEEVYYSICQIGFCMEKINKPIEEIEKNYLKAFRMMYDRCEALYEFALICKRKDLNDIALKYLLLSSKIKFPQHYILFVNKFVYDFAVPVEICDISLKLDKVDIFNKYYDDLNRKPDLPNNIKENLIKMKLILYSNSFSKNIDIKYLIENKKINVSNEKNIILTMTTCKRYILFEKTINSFINCCLDKDLINKWYIVDDNSSEEDREKMKTNYPFIEFVFKTTEQKGHALSMNLIRNYIIENKYKYQIHLEDDWLFYKKLNYIQDSLKIMNVDTFDFIEPNNTYKIQQYENKKIKQVLFNKNYTEIEESIYKGGYICKLKDKLSSNLDNYLLHEYLTEEEDKELYNQKMVLYGLNCMYWPHFSFRPSFIDTSIYEKIGNFYDKGFFEKEYADRYVKENYISVFFNDITSRHIGKLTNDKSDNTFNAYELNNIDQGKGQKSSLINVRENLMKTIEDLENDRKYKLSKKMTKPPNTQTQLVNNYKKIVIDNELIHNDYELTNELKYLFRHNNFNYSKKVINDYYKHYEIWNQLKRDYFYDTYLIINKDNVDLQNIDLDKFIKEKCNTEKNIFVFDNECQIYLIRRSAVIYLLNYIETHSIHTNLLELFKLLENDIQIEFLEQFISKNHLTDELNFEYQNEYEFIPLFDSVGNDICHIPSLTIPMIMEIVKNVDDIICFNTLGYLKGSLDNQLQKIHFFNNNKPDLLHKKDGIYIHKQRYNLKYKEIGKKLSLKFDEYDFYENEMIEGDIVDTFNKEMFYQIKQRCDKDCKIEAFNTNGEMLINCNIEKRKPMLINDKNIWNGTFVKKKYSKKNKWDILQNILVDKHSFEIYIDETFNKNYLIDCIEKTLGKCVFINQISQISSTTNIICIGKNNKLISKDFVKTNSQIIIYSDDEIVNNDLDNIDVVIYYQDSNKKCKDLFQINRCIYVNKLLDYYHQEIDFEFIENKNEITTIKNLENTFGSDKTNAIKYLCQYKSILIVKDDLENVENIIYIIQAYKNNINVVYEKDILNEIENITMKYYLSHLNVNMSKKKSNVFKDNMNYETYLNKIVLPEFKRVFYSN